MSRDERDGSMLGLLIKALIVVGVVFFLISLFIHVLHFLLVLAVVWIIVMIGLAAYHAGRRRGP